MTPTPPPTGRGRLASLLGLVLALLLLGTAPASGRTESATAAAPAPTLHPMPTAVTEGPPPKPVAPGETVVSLTFDDGYANQLSAARVLDRLGMDATFYITSGWIDQPGYLGRADLVSLDDRGHEIGGHTVNHQDLSPLGDTEARRQVCDNRKTLQDWGFSPRSFAYPFASHSAATRSIVQQCGYDTGRSLGDVRSPDSCDDCDPAASLPATDPYELAVPDQVESSWSLSDLQRQVRQAQRGGGGWVVLTLHRVCSDIGSPSCPASQSITPARFQAFAAWLRLQTLNPFAKTRVATVESTHQAALGSSYPPYQPALAQPDAEPAPPGVNAVTNPSLEEVDATTGTARCFEQAGWGTREVTWGDGPARTGSKGASVTITRYESGDAKLMPRMDLGTCSPSVVPGRSYDLGVWYTATGVTQYALYYRTSDGTWRYWTSSPWFAPVTEWTRATWSTPAVPADATAISFGFALIADGTLVTDDYSMIDPGPTG